MIARADCTGREMARIESFVIAEDAGGHEEGALFSEETLPGIERWAVELVKANLEAEYQRSGVDEQFADDCIAEASAAYLARYGRTLAVIQLAVYASSVDPVPRVRGCMVIGFTSGGLRRLNFYRPSNHGICIDDPECSRELERVFS